MNKKIKGFTLLELLITIAIAGILANVAMNSYSSYAKKARRVEAKSILMEVMQREEKYYSENNTYTTNFTTLGYNSILLSPQGNYKVSATTPNNGLTEGIILTASPQNGQTKDTECSSFILNSSGQKTTSTSNNTCW